MADNIDMLIDRLRALPEETEYVEFKHSFSDFEREGKDICALANSAAYHGMRTAYKVWGIDDATHEILGTTFKPRSKKKGNQGLELWLRQQLSDNANFEFVEAECRGLPVVVLKIWPAAHHPVTFQNVAYIRTDSSTQRLAPGSARETELWRRIQQEVFESQTAADGLELEEAFALLEHGAYFDLLGIPRPGSLQGVLHYFEEDGLAFEQDDGRVGLTNMGAVLFAKDLGSFETVRRKALRVIRYEGRGRIGARSEREFTRGYAVDLDLAYSYIDGMTQGNEEVQSARRQTRTLYPEASLRELVINALVHQDFTITGAGPMVEVFDDRVEITNPGSLLVDVERIVNDPPRSRNERLSALMRRLGFCEEAGSGWDKVVAGCEFYQLPAPRIDAHTSVRVSLFQPKEFKALTPEERLQACYWHACLQYSEGGYATNASLRERFGIKASNSAQVSRLIKTAVEQQLIKPVDPTTSSRYMRYIPFWA